MDVERIRELLALVATGKCSVEKALETLRHLPYEDLGFARVDHHRSLRLGVAEAVFAPGKTPAQIAAIVERLVSRSGRALVTRLAPEVAAQVQQALAERHLAAPVRYDAQARLLMLGKAPPAVGLEFAAVISAGTADIPVAEEAALTAEFLGARVERLYDVGVAGLHRLLERLELLRRAAVVVAVAGMEGALPTVVGGLVPCPVIGVPTSAGYGVGTGGLASLLTMLNSCAPGVAVVNIDNGFGAGVLAFMLARGRGTGEGS